MSKRLSNKDDSLIQKVNTKNMSSSKIQAEIAATEKLMQTFISQSNYPQAEKCNEKIEALKKALKTKKVKEVNLRHMTEKENLKIDHDSDYNELSSELTKKFDSLKFRCNTEIEELKNKQNEEMKNLISKFEKECSDAKPSSRYLKLEKEEEGLVKLRKFKEAEVIRKQKLAQKMADMNKYKKNNEASLNFMKKKLHQKHVNEINYCKTKYDMEYEELNREKNKELENLDRKYLARNKDLVNQQKREKNISHYNNYGKRISKLHNDYGYKVGTKKNELTPKPQKKDVQRIYAEIKNNKIEVINLGGKEAPKEKEIEKEENNDSRIGNDENQMAKIDLNQDNFDDEDKQEEKEIDINLEQE